MKPEFKQAIRSHRWHIAGAVLLILVLAAIYLVSSSRYPIALVNGETITARQVAVNYLAAQKYFDSLVKTYPQDAPEKPDAAKIKLAVLNQLVERALIAQGAQLEAGADLDALVRDKVERYASAGDLAQAADTLYGLSTADFQKEVLVPQAEADILSGRLFLRGEKLEDWLMRAKDNAQVVILSGNYAWDGENIVVK